MVKDKPCGPRRQSETPAVFWSPNKRCPASKESLRDRCGEYTQVLSHMDDRVTTTQPDNRACSGPWGLGLMRLVGSVCAPQIGANICIQ
ncbi:hypothetical protein RRG08_019045 [Elysia crispata]|uniref:Uncharacterized protein n=1 Tax=Elysia crispata TaxID=231223 RepID=A0AAE1A4Z1_9GAST|nr:hypothetical protein RRG08_019045 [Elysia crispata]